MHTSQCFILGFLLILLAGSLEAQSQLLAPKPIRPTDRATAVRINPTFVWSASAGATAYELNVSTDSTFSVVTIKLFGIADTTYHLTGLLHKTFYYWRVSATNTSLTSPFSLTSSFRSHVTPGDFNGSGEYQAVYASYILRHVVALSVLTGDALETGEVSGDGTLSAYDAALMLEFVAGLLTVFPVDQ